MKILIPLFFLLLLTSCKKQPKEINLSDEEVAHINMHKEMGKAMIEYDKFETSLKLLYKESKNNPKIVIKKADSLLKQNSTETNSYKMPNRKVVASELNYLKAELYYNLGQCDSSLAILKRSGYHSCDDALAIAANYTKLKNHEMARMYVDSINCYIEDYALANYYETIGDKNSALKIYRETKRHREWGHYKYYKLTLKRIDELEKPNPKLLTELYFPTGDPAYDITDDDDNELRGKIFALLDTLPECNGLERHIFRSPKTNDKDYYWIKVGKNIIVSHDYEPDYKAQYDFFIYAKDLSVKHYDPETKTLLSLEDWRKTRNNQPKQK